MYVFKSTLNLATTASPIDNNLALCSSKDSDILADALAVIHENFINVIAVMNPSRRSKYVPLSKDEQNTKGVIKQVKWVDIDGIRYFVIVSTNGLQVYDDEISNLVYDHAIRETGDDSSYCKGICVLRSNILCVGTCLGTVWMFKPDGNGKGFRVLNRVYAHDETLTLLEGIGSFMISSSDFITYMWSFNEKDFDIIRKLEVPGVTAAPTVIRFHLGLVVIAYASGEFCIFDLKDEEFYTRTTAHKLRITGMDFSSSFTILTASNDCYVKLWKYQQLSNTVELLQSIQNEEGPLYAVAFLNYSTTEFCTVTGGDTKVKVYIDWENEVEINVKDE